MDADLSLTRMPLTERCMRCAGTSPYVIANTLKRFLLTLLEPLLTYKWATLSL